MAPTTSPTDAAIRFTFAWETKQATQEMKTLSNSFDQLVGYQKVIGDAFGALKGQAEDGLEELKRALILSAKEYQDQAGSILANRLQGPSQEMLSGLAEQLGIGPNSSAADVNALFELANEENEKVIKDLKVILNIKKDMSRAGAAVWNEMLNIEQSTAKIKEDIDGIDKNTDHWLKSLHGAGKGIKGIGSDFKDVALGLSPVIAANIVDKDVGALRYLRGQAGFSEEQIRQLGTEITSRLTGELGGMIDPSDIISLIATAAQRKFDYKEIPDMIKQSVMMNQYLGNSNEDSLDFLEIMIHKIGLGTKETEKMVAQMQFFARETQTATSEMDNIVLSAEDYIIQLDKMARPEGIKQIAALGAGLSSVGMSIEQIMGTINKGREGFTNPNVVIQSGYIEGLANVDQGTIANLFLGGKPAEAFQIIQDAITKVRRDHDDIGMLQIRRFMEEQLGFQGNQFDKFAQGKLNFTELLSKGEGIDKAFGEANVGYMYLIERIGNMLEGLFKDFGRTFQQFFEVPVRAVYHFTNDIYTTWMKMPTPIRDAVNAVVGLSLAIGGLMKIGPLITKLQNLPMIGSSLTSMFSSLRSIPILGSIGEGISTVGTTLGGISASTLATIGAAIAVIAGGIYGLYKWGKKFKEEGGGDLLLKLFDSDSPTKFVNNLTSVIRKLDETGTWIKWIIATPLTFLMKAWEDFFDSKMMKSIQRVEDTLRGMFISASKMASIYIGDPMEKAFDKVFGGVKLAWKTTSDFFKSTWEEIKETFTKFFNFLDNIPGFGIIKGIGNSVSSGFNSFADTFSKFEEIGRQERLRANAPTAKPIAATMAKPATNPVARKKPSVVSTIPAHPTATFGKEGHLGGVPYEALIHEAAKKFGVEPALIAAIIKQESKFDPHARSHKDARGLMQIMPRTARHDFGLKDADELYNPRTNIMMGTEYLSNLLKATGGDMSLAIAAYNGGIGNVRLANGQRATDEHPIRAGKDNIPPFRETQDYVRKVTGNYSEYSKDSGLAQTEVVAAVDNQTDKLVKQLKSLEKVLREEKAPGYRDVSGAMRAPGSGASDLFTHTARYD